MRVLSLAARDWRNIEELRLDCGGDFVVIHGDNGQGKTNILEAVWMLATLRSFREHSPGRMIRHGAESATLRAEVSGTSGRRVMTWSRIGRKRRLEVDESSPSRLEDWFSLLRAILFCPADGEIIRGQPALRRRVVDRAAFTANPVHLSLIKDFQRVIRQKSSLLKEPRVDLDQLDIWDQELIELGARVALRRSQIIEELRQPFAEMHARIAGHDRVSIRMRSVRDESHDLDETRARIRSEIERHRRDEIRRQQVLVGPQRDDLIFELDGRSARNFASQGQVRSVVLAFKLAELQAAKLRGDQPLFLLDDLTSELDRSRMTRLIGVLGELDSQVWMTTTDPNWLGPLPGDRTASIKVRQGMVISA